MSYVEESGGAHNFGFIHYGIHPLIPLALYIDGDAYR